MARQVEEVEVGCVKSHFFDSGSFSLWTKAAEYAKANSCSPWDYYDTKDFWDYVDSYIVFVKKFAVAIDHYANVDAIPNPEITWRNQQYLEKNGLNPVPVVHYQPGKESDITWLKHYVQKGYDYIALGGLVGSTSTPACRAWLDACFDYVCGGKDRLPAVKIHGFGVTTFDLLWRLPFYSVDSTAWTMIGANGGIIVPKRRTNPKTGKQEFSFTDEPWICKTSTEPSRKEKARGARQGLNEPHSLREIDDSRHFLKITGAERRDVLLWLASIGVPLGMSNDKQEPVEFGVINRHSERKMANLIYFERLCEYLPPWPWPFQTRARRSFGLI